MFGLGASEIVVILALILIVFGPQKMPELARQLARLVGDLRRAADDVKQNFDEATREPPPNYQAPALNATADMYHTGAVPEGAPQAAQAPTAVAEGIAQGSAPPQDEEVLEGTEPAPSRREVAAAEASAPVEPSTAPKVNSEEPAPVPNTRAPNGRPS